MTTDQVHAGTVVGERANSGQRGRFVYTCRPHGVPQEYARDVEAQSATQVHTSEARGGDRGPGVRGPGADLGQR